MMSYLDDYLYRMIYRHVFDDVVQEMKRKFPYYKGNIDSLYRVLDPREGFHKKQQRSNPPSNYFDIYCINKFRLIGEKWAGRYPGYKKPAYYNDPTSEFAQNQHRIARLNIRDCCTHAMAFKSTVNVLIIVSKTMISDGIYMMGGRHMSDCHKIIRLIKNRI